MLELRNLGSQSSSAQEHTCSCVGCVPYEDIKHSSAPGDMAWWVEGKLNSSYTCSLVYKISFFFLVHLKGDILASSKPGYADICLYNHVKLTLL